MADDADGFAPPGISALPLNTVRRLGSHQLLTDPSSVIKELIDNALDARAKSIFVDIAANTIDSIQVKDDGHGIPSEDRALACRRYCTSKIRDFQDLKQIGGKWLGFRGEALASISDMSGTLSLTTRVEGEPVAVKLSYECNGELVSTERESHPVGTTVKITKLLDSAKVRREMAVKNSAKCLAKIRRLMQAYALARPATRFRLQVMKAKNNKGAFVYAPKTDANVEDAAFKVIGKDCALQCDWTALEMSGYNLQAFLPKPSAFGSKVANYGAFISVDSRPMSAIRGTIKKIVIAFKRRLRKANPTLTNVKDPFFCMDIVCPMDSYDPNIEPAKDDVIFDDENSIVTLVERLLSSYYPDDISSTNSVNHTELEEVVSLQSIQECSIETSSPQPHLSYSAHSGESGGELAYAVSVTQPQQSSWKSSMYGIDEEDLEFLQPDTSVVVEEEEGCRDITISNPWTIARMNAPVKSSRTANNGQLPSPAKSQKDASAAHRSPTPAVTPARSTLFEPATPQTMSPANARQSRLDHELQHSIRPLEQVASDDVAITNYSPGPRIRCPTELPSFKDRMSIDFFNSEPQASAIHGSVSGTKKARDSSRPRRPFKNKPVVLRAPQAEDTWFGQPMNRTPKAARPQKRFRQERSTCPKDDSCSPKRSLLFLEAERLDKSRLASENNTDIRNFFSKPRCGPADGVFSVENDNTQPPKISNQLRADAGRDNPGVSRRPQSADSWQRTNEEMDKVFQLHQHISSGLSSTPIRSSRPSNVAPATQITPHLRRSRTADGGLHRTRSSTLRLNFIPHGYATQSLALTVKTSVLSIEQQIRKLDMTVNSLEWGYASTDSLDVFSTPVFERKIMNWVVTIDSLLCAVFEPIVGVEVRGALHEGIQRFLDARKADAEADDRFAIIATSAQISGPVDCDNGLRGLDSRADLLPRQPVSAVLSGLEQADDKREVFVDAAIESDEYKEDFDISQYVDLDGGARHSSPMRVVKTEDEFGDGVDDEEMLMGL